MGSAIASPSTTPVAFVGRPRGPPRCKSAPLYHRAQVARPISQGLQGGETPFCARLRPVAPSCAWLRSPAPFCALLHPSAPSHPDPFTLLHRHTPALRVTSSIVATTFPDGISLESPLSYSLCSLRGNRLKSTTGQSLLTRCFFFRVVRV